MIPYRDENPTYTTPYVNYLLIIINVVVFFFEILNGNRMGIFASHALIPYEFWAAPIANFPRIFSSMFLHAGWMHIIGNMLFLWIFGDNIEDVLGHLRYLIFYLLAGLSGAMLHLIFFARSPIPVVGASGAISGVIAAYLIFFPGTKIRMLLLIFRVRLRAFWFLGFWVASQILSGVSSIGAQTAGGTAYLAHLGGIGYGLIFGIFRGSRLMNEFKRRTAGKKTIEKKANF